VQVIHPHFAKHFYKILLIDKLPLDYYISPMSDIKKYQLFFPFENLKEFNGLSLREVSRKSDISRMCLQSILQQDSSVSVQSIQKLANFFNREVDVFVSEELYISDYSTLGVAYQVERDGFGSWKIYFMNFVDEFRKKLNPYLIILPPHSRFDKRLTALLASIVCKLCEEVGMNCPAWARRRYFLDKPWFPAEINSLKASAILESPTCFRNNNIFVHSNFLSRV
jgi:transcriptional regulator with XRE-family HTH domain